MCGLGFPEIFVLAIIGSLVVAVGVLISRKSKGDGELAELRAENRRLREENERLMKGSA